jgi:hypothetical protein
MRYSNSKSKLTLSAWLAVLPVLSSPRLRVTFDLEMELHKYAAVLQ